MQGSRLVCLLVALSAGLAGCSTAPPAPPQANQSTAPVTAQPSAAPARSAAAAAPSAAAAPTAPAVPAAPTAQSAPPSTPPAGASGFGAVHALSLSPSGKTLALDTYHGVALVSLPDRRLLYSALRWAAGEAPLFSPDGSLVVIGTPERAADGLARLELRRASDGDQIATIEGQYPRFSPDGQTLLTDGQTDCLHQDGTTLLWRASDGQRIAELKGLTAIFSADSALIATASNDPGQGQATLRIFRSPSGQALAETSAPGGQSYWFHPRQPLLIVQSDQGQSWRLQGLRVPELTALWSLDAAQSDVRSLWLVDISPDGAALAVRDTDKRTELWAFVAPDRLERRARIADSQAGWFSGDGQRWYAVSGQDSLQVWDVAAGTPGATFAGLFRVPTADGSRPADWSYSSFSPGPDIALAKTYEDGSGARLLAARDGRVLVERQGLEQVSVSRDGRTAALADADGTVSLADLSTGQSAVLDAAAYPQLLHSSPRVARQDPPVEGALVAYIQERLDFYGYPTAADGVYGQATETAVRRFQQDWGLEADGVVGPQTWAILRGTPRLRLTEPPTRRPVVRTLQTLLTRWGASVAEDGVYGAETDAAVRRFQQQSGLSVDGVVGPKTWELLQYIPGDHC